MVALSTVGSVMATMFAGSRLMFVSARDGLFPQALSGLHRSFKTPVPAIMLMVRYSVYDNDFTIFAGDAGICGYHDWRFVISTGRL